jgi:hypothetical protein
MSFQKPCSTFSKVRLNVLHVTNVGRRQQKKSLHVSYVLEWSDYTVTGQLDILSHHLVISGSGDMGSAELRYVWTVKTMFSIQVYTSQHPAAHSVLRGLHIQCNRQSTFLATFSLKEKFQTGCFRPIEFHIIIAAKCTFLSRQHDGRHQIPITAPWLSTYRKTKTWTTVKETTGWIQLWGRNRSFIGLTSWPEEEEEMSVAEPGMLTSRHSHIFLFFSGQKQLRYRSNKLFPERQHCIYDQPVSSSNPMT